MLGENFTQKRLLGKILRADHDGVAPARAATDEERGGEAECRRGFQQTHTRRCHRNVTARAAGGVRARSGKNRPTTLVRPRESRPRESGDYSPWPGHEK